MELLRYLAQLPDSLSVYFQPHGMVLETYLVVLLAFSLEFGTELLESLTLLVVLLVVRSVERFVEQ